jgi:hypothetical protein
MKHVIHTSERKDFKRCRQLWDFRSPNRLSLEPKSEARALVFGTAIHAAEEVFYDPATWNADRDVVQATALLAFKDALPYTDDQDMEEWEAELKLGVAMLNHYFQWAASKDKGLTPKYVEIEFEVPLLPPFGMDTWGEDLEPDGSYSECIVAYAGRIDALVEDEYGGLWIMDHKTAGKFDSEDFLVMDQQVTSYCWALQHMLGIKIEGFIYNELRKDAPHKPAVLQNGTLSKAKNQNTTFDLYLTAIKEGGYPVNLYSDILDYFKNQGNKFFKRTYVRRSPRELELAGEVIALEAADMLSNPSIYPNPDRHCSYCAFRAPCLARMDGSDYGWILDGNFIQKEQG